MLSFTVLKSGVFFLFITLTYQGETSGGNSGQENAKKGGGDCIKEWQLCRPGDKCCNNLSCNGDQCVKPCYRFQPCAKTEDCCTENENTMCDKGFCLPNCWPTRFPCTKYITPCCDGICVDGRCTSVKACRKKGQSCEPEKEVCCDDQDLVCRNRTCVSSCLSENGKCDRRGRSFFSHCCDSMYCSERSKCTACKIYGDKCSGNKDECCNNDLSYAPQECVQGVCRRPCFPNGSTCQEHYECCSRECNNGKCNEPCGILARPCKTVKDCCPMQFKVTCGEYNLCQKVDNCSKIGTKCSGNDDCCLSNCVKGVCKLPCSEEGTSCRVDKDCCDGGFCVRKLCQKKPCIEKGLQCKHDEDCCSNFCKSGTCQYKCVPDGVNECSKHEDCCNFNCQKGTCCSLNNQVCERDEECCGKFCASGICAFKCSPAKGPCTKAADCCFTSICVNGQCGKNCLIPGYFCLNCEDCCSGKSKNGVCE